MVDLFERAHAAVGAWWALALAWSRREPGPPLFTLDAARSASRDGLSLPTSPAPEVSVIIPVHGKAEVTWTCLASIARAQVDLQFEVILVDDASPDDTLELVASVSGLERVPLERNVGFIGACNAGAERALGSTLVFLNNDTTVTDGWLDALLRAFALHPRAGIVGGRLLFPSGRLQEAGGTVFRDGSGSHFGRNRWPGRSRYLYARPVDYVSGACLAIPAELFRDLGGFDDHFAPAYYEDTDLAFRVRAAGREVWYQPSCRVYHYEGLTSGRDLSQGPKRHQVINQERFYARWKDILREEHPAPGRRTERSASRHGGPRLVVVGAEGATLGLGRQLLQAAREAAWRPAWWSRTLSAGEAAELREEGVEVLEPSLGVPWRQGGAGERSGVIVLAEPSIDEVRRAQRAAAELDVWGLALKPVSPDLRTQLDATVGPWTEGLRHFDTRSGLAAALMRWARPRVR